MRTIYNISEAAQVIVNSVKIEVDFISVLSRSEKGKR